MTAPAKRAIRAAGAVALGVAASVLSPVAARCERIVLSDVAVVDVADGSVAQHRQVTIDGDTVVDIRDQTLAAPAGGRVVDAHGKYLIPGLWDMHVHLRTRKLVSDLPAPELVAENRASLELYLAYGVTSIFDLGSDIPEELVAWREAIASGDLLGPNLYSTGPKLEGPNPAFAGSLVVVDRKSADEALALLERSRVDAVKIMALWMDPDVLAYVLERASQLGLRSFVHSLETVPATELSDRGVAAIAHVDNVVPEAAPVFDELCTALRADRPPTQRPGELYGRRAREFFADPQPEAMRRVLDHLARNRTAVISTLAVIRAEADHSLIPEQILQPLALMSTRFADPVRARHERLLGADVTTRSRLRYTASRRLLQLMPATDVLLLIGTDSGFGNHAPGAIYDHELAALQEAGLPPAYVLRAATANAARFMGLQGHQGAVGKGMRADLVLLDANPLEDVRHTAAVHAVIRAGRWLGPEWVASRREGRR